MTFFSGCGEMHWLVSSLAGKVGHRSSVLVAPCRLPVDKGHRCNGQVAPCNRLVAKFGGRVQHGTAGAGLLPHLRRPIRVIPRTLNGTPLLRLQGAAGRRQLIGGLS